MSWKIGVRVADFLLKGEKLSKFKKLLAAFYRKLKKVSMILGLVLVIISFGVFHCLSYPKIWLFNSLWAHTNRWSVIAKCVRDVPPTPGPYVLPVGASDQVMSRNWKSSRFTMKNFINSISVWECVNFMFLKLLL